MDLMLKWTLSRESWSKYADPSLRRNQMPSLFCHYFAAQWFCGKGGMEMANRKSFEPGEAIALSEEHLAAILLFRKIQRSIPQIRPLEQGDGDCPLVDLSDEDANRPCTDQSATFNGVLRKLGSEPWESATRQAASGIW